MAASIVSAAATIAFTMAPRSMGGPVKPTREAQRAWGKLRRIGTFVERLRTEEEASKVQELKQLARTIDRHARRKAEEGVSKLAVDLAHDSTPLWTTCQTSSNA